jgi:DNA-binding MarR family transcriptional regulator
MADVCRRLEDRGLIARTTAPSDGRRKLLELTPEGRDALERTRQRVAALEGELLASRVGDHDRLLADLEALSQRWETVASAPPP